MSPIFCFVSDLLSSSSLPAATAFKIVYGFQSFRFLGSQLGVYGSQGIQCLVASIQIQPNGNGWLYRSVIAKIRKLLSTEELEKEFNLENVQDVQIKVLGGRFVILTFPNEESEMQQSRKDGL